jgi:hypothetical protein
MLIRYSLAPPYAEPQTISRGAESNLAPGAILLLRPAHDTVRESISIEIRAILHRAPYLTVCLWLDLLRKQAVPETSIQAGDLGIRGVVTRAVITPVGLRAQITQPSHLPRDIVYRLEMLRFRVNTTVAQFVAAACRHARDCRTLKGLTRKHSVEYGRVNRSLAHARLPTPAKLYHILRLLAVTIELQREPSTYSLSVVADRFGYWDDAALRARFREVLGFPPATVRQWIGWERLLYVALRRAGVSSTDAKDR